MNFEKIEPESPIKRNLKKYSPGRDGLLKFDSDNGFIYVERLQKK